MTGISGISNDNYLYGKFATGKKINKAADGAAEMAIINKLNAQDGGLKASSNNISSARDMMNIADGALSSTTDGLQRINELSVRAMNGLYSDSDLAAIQNEVDQLSAGMAQTANITKYNEMNLLDGSNSMVNIVTNPDGSGMNVTNGDGTLSAMGMTGYTVGSQSSLNTVSDALKYVTSTRTVAGAQYNALGHAYNNNQTTMLNTQAATSRLEDLDYGKAVSDVKKQKLLADYSVQMQRKQMENQMNSVNRMFQ